MGFGVSREMKSTISQHLTPSTMNNIHRKKKEMTTKQHKVELGVKSKDGVMIRDKEQLTERWKEYVEELYNDAKITKREL